MLSGIACITRIIIGIIICEGDDHLVGWVVSTITPYTAGTQKYLPRKYIKINIKYNHSKLFSSFRATMNMIYFQVPSSLCLTHRFLLLQNKVCNETHFKPYSIIISSWSNWWWVFDVSLLCWYWPLAISPGNWRN